MKEIIKPSLKTKTYYDFVDSWEYIKNKYKIKDSFSEEGETTDLWSYLCDTREIHNGCFITFSDWELKHENGKFAYMIPKWFAPVLNAFLDEFGEIDKECLTPNIRTADFYCSW